MILSSVFWPQPIAQAAATDWPQFRGPHALGISPTQGLPLTWSDTSNVVWRTTLPGPGASSPIVLGHRIYLTCSTGVRTASAPSDDAQALHRHLLCLDAGNGAILWRRSVPALLPEQERIREDHGYTSSTPAADADRIYAFYGKSGVFAFDHQGKQLWHHSVGDQLNGWGSAASPVLHGNLLLVNASVESESVVALDKTTGTEVWRARGIKESWHAPVVARNAAGQDEVIIAMFRKVLGLDAATGAERWRADTGIPWYMCPTPVAHGDLVYSIGGRNPNGALAIRLGGQGDVTSSHVVWKLNKGSNVPSPVFHEGYLYFAHENLGIVYCVDAQTGALAYEERLQPSPGQIYASPLCTNGRIYFTGRGGRTVVLAATPNFARLADNTLEAGRGMFNASPAVVGNRLLLRSDRALYCLGQE